MSLLFESAIGDFDLSSATLYSPPVDALEQTRDEPVPLDGIIEYASYHERLAHPKKDDWVAIPLHGRDTAELSGEYIAFTEHTLHGEVFIYHDDDDYAPIDRDAFARSPIAERIRFWHSDYAPDEPPSYFDSPIAAASHRAIQSQTRQIPSSTNSSRSGRDGRPTRGKSGKNGRVIA